VLVIDDNLDAADSLRDFLELSGHAVEVAHDGPEGIHLAGVFRPEVVFCDIGLPGMDGHAVARAMRADETFARAHLAKPPRIEELERHLATPAAYP
jgi:two-component system CheB/CheR fusion protein